MSTGNQARALTRSTIAFCSSFRKLSYIGATASWNCFSSSSVRVVSVQPFSSAIFAFFASESSHAVRCYSSASFAQSKMICWSSSESLSMVCLEARIISGM